MRTIAILFIALFAVIGTAAAQSDTVFTCFEGKAIAAIKADGAFTITVRRGERTRVTVSVPERLKERFSAELLGERLTLAAGKSANLRRNEKCLVNVTCPSLSDIDLSGVCALTLEGGHAADRLSVRASGVSSVEWADTITVRRSARLVLEGVSSVKGLLLCDTLDIEVGGNSSLVLSGEGETADIRITGTSQADLQALVLTEAVAKATGNSRVSLHILDTLRAEASGLSRVTYAGSPQSLDLKATGMAKISESSRE